MNREMIPDSDQDGLLDRLEKRSHAAGSSFQSLLGAGELFPTTD